MKRWLIRSLFLGLLLLCVGGWVRSYDHYDSVDFWGKRLWEVAAFKGDARLVVMELMPWELHKGWFYTQLGPQGIEYFSGEDQLKFAGLRFGKGMIFMEWTPPHNFYYLQIPFWFPTALSAVALLLVWQKTRAKTIGRAFPVALKNTSGKKGDSAV